MLVPLLFSLNSQPDGFKLSSLLSGSFNPGNKKTRCLLQRRVGAKFFGQEKKKFSPLSGVEPRFFGLPAHSVVTIKTGLNI